MPLESSVEDWVVQYSEERGGRALKITGYKGFPDRLVILPDAVVFFVETKTKGGRVATAQKIWHKILRGLGFKVYVPYDRAAVRRIFTEEE